MAYKTVDKNTSQKYLINAVSVLSLLDKDVDQETKVKTVANLANENNHLYTINITSKEELCGTPYSKLKATNSASEITVKLRQDFDDLLTVEEE